MANQYRITTNGKRFRVEVFYTGEMTLSEGPSRWRPYGDGTYESQAAAQRFMDFIDQSGEWVPVVEPMAVQS